MEEMQPALLALERLFLSCAHLRLRCEIVCPSIKSYGDWSDNTKAMRIAENVLRPSNADLRQDADNAASNVK